MEVYGVAMGGVRLAYFSANSRDIIVRFRDFLSLQNGRLKPVGLRNFAYSQALSKTTRLRGRETRPP